MARIVRPGGGVAVFWNVRDAERSPFVADYHRLLEGQFGEADTGQYLQAGRATGRERTERAFKEAAGFDAPELSELRHEIQVTPEEFVGMTFTASYVRSLPPEEQGRFRQEVVKLLAGHGLEEGRPFTVPYRVDLWTARRQA
jgi:hypothetical protein